MNSLFRPPAAAWAVLTVIPLLSSCALVAGPGGGGPSPATSPSRPEASPEPLPPLRADPIPPVTGTVLPLPDEVRALWVVRTTLSHPDSIRAMVERADRSGFNTLIVQVRGRGDAYYRSRWEPSPETLDAAEPGFDPLGLVVREAHARGMGVHAWVNGHLVGNSWSLPSSPWHLVNRRPDLLAVPRDLARELYWVDPFDARLREALLEYAQENRERVEGLYSAPSHPEVKEHLYSIWMDLLESYELDGLHFDYIRYPNPEFDYSRGALERFRVWVAPRLSTDRLAQLEEAYRRDPLALVDSLPGSWDEFRRAQITDLVERIYHGVKKRRPEVVVSAAVFANADDAYRSRFQDWRGWIRSGILDAVAPMAYTPDNGLFEEQIRSATEVAGSGRVWAGIGIYQNTFTGTVDKIRIARSLGARGLVLFSYDWAVTEGESDGGRSFLDRVGAEVFRSP